MVNLLTILHQGIIHLNKDLCNDIELIQIHQDYTTTLFCVFLAKQGNKLRLKYSALKNKSKYRSICFYFLGY